MTAAQLRRLAGQAQDAQRFYRRTNPPAARLFGDTAHVASLLADRLGREEQLASIGADLEAVKAELAPDLS